MKNRRIAVDEWLEESPINSIGNHEWTDADNDTHNDAYKLVKALREAGAVELHVVVYEDDEWATLLEVKLPEEHDKQIKILAEIATFHADGVTVKDGICTIEWC